MKDSTGWRGSAIVRRVIAVSAATTIVIGLGAGSGGAAEQASRIPFTAAWTQAETVTVQETATVDGFEGRGEATATATATAEHTETAASLWELYTWTYTWTYFWAYAKASTQAKQQAEAKARPQARERAEAAAQAKADEAAKVSRYTHTATVEQTVTIRESHTIGDIVGRGEATATASGTASHTATAATDWEAYYWAVTKAHELATEKAREEATKQARTLALQRAEADALAQVEAEEGAEPDPDASPYCGPEILKEDGTPWTCTLSDDFRGTELDRDVWVPQQTAVTGWAGEDCYVDDDDSIAVGGGVLSLTTRKSPEPFTCESPKGDFQTQWTSASLSTFGTFTQAYGRYEFRARFPDVSVPGVHSALWMWPENDHRYGLWPHSGEIDIIEVYSRYPDRGVPMLHYNAPMGENGTGRTNQNCLLDPSQWNTYVAEWTEDGITISYGGEVCLEHEWNALAPLTGSQPFDQPFMLAITQALGRGDNAPTGATPDVSTMDVDYVRAWS